MSETHSQPRWFALTVRPNHERSSEVGLLAQGIEAYVPRYRSRRKWSDRTKEVNAIRNTADDRARRANWKAAELLLPVNGGTQ